MTIKILEVGPVTIYEEKPDWWTEPKGKNGRKLIMGLCTIRRCSECSELFRARTLKSRFCKTRCSERWHTRGKRVECTAGCGRVGRDSDSIGVWTCSYCANGWIDSKAFKSCVYENDYVGALIELEKLVDKKEGGCWEWTGYRNDAGYGLIGLDRGLYGLPSIEGGNSVSIGVHRVALSLKEGRRLATGEQSHHKCSNILCVNPDHLQIATQIENMAEMKARRSYEARIKQLEAEVISLKERVQTLEGNTLTNPY